jgi:hypothetical protein
MKRPGPKPSDTTEYRLAQLTDAELASVLRGLSVSLAEVADLSRGQHALTLLGFQSNLRVLEADPVSRTPGGIIHLLLPLVRQEKSETRDAESPA